MIINFEIKQVQTSKFTRKLEKTNFYVIILEMCEKENTKDPNEYLYTKVIGEHCIIRSDRADLALHWPKFKVQSS